MPPALFFFLKILWTLQVFCDAKTFLAVFFFFFSFEKGFWDTCRDCIESVDNFR